MAEYYEIKIKGNLDAGWSEWFAGLTLTHLEGNETLLSGPFTLQSCDIRKNMFTPDMCRRALDLLSDNHYNGYIYPIWEKYIFW